MNLQISRLAVFAVVLIVALVVGTTYWQTWAAPGLADRQDNAIQRVAQFTIKRGLIRTEVKRVLLAANRERPVKGETLFFRRYPQGGLFAHIVGYSTQVRSRTGLEESMNDYLTGTNENLNTVLRRLGDEIRGKTLTGNDLFLTARPAVQRLALRLLGPRCGSVVALDPRTGEILVAASSPTYDPNLVERRFGQIDRIRAGCRPAAPLLNRATAGLYVPGSTFKVVTAAAALDSGRFKPDSPFSDPGYCVEYGQRIFNAGNPDQGLNAYGSVSLFQGLQYSINSVFCNLGKALGGKLILEYAKRFGFYRDPPLETPDDERRPSGLYKGTKLFDPKTNFQVDPGRLAFGQERLLVTPLQMAMVAAAIANRGILMRPYVVDRVLSPGGEVVTRTRSDVYSRPIKPVTAAQLRAMMEAAVSGGTGTAAQIPGVRVGGKTGTAETGQQGVNTTWFIAFAPVERPRVAIAVVLENQTGFGGTTAAPLAKVVMQALLGVPSNS